MQLTRVFDEMLEPAYNDRIAEREADVGDYLPLAPEAVERGMQRYFRVKHSFAHHCQSRFILFLFQNKINAFLIAQSALSIVFLFVSYLYILNINAILKKKINNLIESTVKVYLFEISIFLFFAFK